MAGYALSAQEGTPADFAERHALLKATRESTAGAFSLIDIVDPRDTGRHVHEREDEAFLILGGDHVFECGDESFAVGPGAYLFLPRGVPHAHRRVGDRGASRMLVMVSPPGFERFFLEIAAAESAGRALDAAFYDDLSRRYGIRWV